MTGEQHGHHLVQFRDAARRLGDLVASDADRSTVVQELEAAATAPGSAAA